VVGLDQVLDDVISRLLVGVQDRVGAMEQAVGVAGRDHRFLSLTHSNAQQYNCRCGKT
jgi:hypothetical protein